MKYCEVCGEPIGRNKRFCSKSCESKYRQHYRICPVCGKSFACPPANDNVCCSKECSAAHRTQLHASGVYTDAVSKMTQARDKYLLENCGEKHFNAKHWIIQAPEGQIYEVQNLSHFIKNNPDLFDGTYKQAYDGIIKIKASYQGKRKVPCYTWKGWSLLKWGD